MKPEELMIGDWYCWEAEGKKYYYQVTKETFSSPDYDIYNFQPIQLTPEILEKNGAFKNPLMGEQRHFIYNLSGFELLAIYDADFSFQINKGARKIKYVHELQHALKLCGIEKTIEL